MFTFENNRHYVLIRSVDIQISKSNGLFARYTFKCAVQQDCSVEILRKKLGKMLCNEPKNQGEILVKSQLNRCDSGDIFSERLFLL